MSAPPPVTFKAYRTQVGNNLVQEWFDGLAVEDREELQDTVNHLLSMPMTEWKRPEFDKVNPPLHEIRCKSNKLNHVLRMYGAWDVNVRGQFNFLASNRSKKTDKDVHTQKLALRRLRDVVQGKGDFDEFSFEEQSERTA